METRSGLTWAGALAATLSGTVVHCQHHVWRHSLLLGVIELSSMHAHPVSRISAFDFERTRTVRTLEADEKTRARLIYQHAIMTHRSRLRTVAPFLLSELTAAFRIARPAIYLCATPS